jgi:hypothetical protein
MSVSYILSKIASQYDSDPARDDFISLAATRVNYCMFGNNSELAHAYMTAHMLAYRDLTLKSGGLSLGEITSLKQGDLSISMKASGVQGNSELGTTTYGKAFLQLQNGSIPALGLTGIGGFCDVNPMSQDE